MKFSEKYLKVKEIKNSNNYYVELKIKLITKEIKNKDDIIFFNNLFKNSNIKDQIYIYDIIEENNILYVISTKENISKIEHILNNKSNLQREGIVFNNTKPITKNEIDHLYKHENSMCKIRMETIINNETVNGVGTGFFCLINDNDIPFTKALFTNNHVLNKKSIEVGKTIVFEFLNNTIELEISENRRCFTNEKLDYTCIEIFEDDKFTDSVNFFKIEPNMYKDQALLRNEEIFILQYPNGGELSFASGKILEVKKNFLFHSASTCKGSSGSPIIRRYKNNFILGIHFGGLKANDEYFYYNHAIPIDTIIKDIKKILFESNTIIAKFKIKEDNTEAKIINSYENAVREGLKLENNSLDNNNEEKIKNCIIFINDDRLKTFEYVHKFPKKGEYIIKYIFRDSLNSTNYMFLKCKNIIELDLSHFNTNNVTNMSGMLQTCESLKKLNLTNFQTKNVRDMSFMFYECESLTSLNLSHLNTEKAINMDCMFDRCISLKSLDLSNLNATNVKSMTCMFWGCRSLINLNLAKFRTKNINNMLKMFCGCNSLPKLDLSDFITDNVTNMQCMFMECYSLKEINLKSFNTSKVTIMADMFFRCKSLISLDLSKFTIENLNNMDGMFAECESLKNLNVSKFDSKNKISMNWIFSGVKNLQKKNVITNNQNILNQL
jgi:surface protein